jgi:hypothetical protein
MGLLAEGPRRYRSAMLFVVLSRYVSRNPVRMLLANCRYCVGEHPHTLFRERRTIALFWFIPIWIQTRYSLLCASCKELVGASPYPIPNARAMEILAESPSQ